MLDNIPKISVLVITYNQEDVISRAIESLLSQKDYIYEICVSDDCSNDRTWEILQDYSNQNPGLFVLNRNEPNLGIFENIEKSWTMPTGDIVSTLAGDDACGEGWFKRVVNYLKKENIDYKNELFCIYGDYIGVAPNGKLLYHSNNRVLSNVKTFSLALRGIVSNRGCCYGIKVHNKFVRASQGRSHIAESVLDRQMQLFTKTNYYIPQVANIYYTGIGASTSITNYDTYRERKEINPYLIKILQPYGYTPTKSDLRYMAYEASFMDFLYSKSLINCLVLLYRWLLSYDSQIGIKSLNLPYVFSHVKKLFIK